MSTGLFPALLGMQFASLDACVQCVHSGDNRHLVGTANVERGDSLIARILGRLTSLPPALKNAPMQVRIWVNGQQERWIRTYADKHIMKSRLFRGNEGLVERLGPASFTFLLVVRDAGIDWQLTHVSMLGIPLPLRWFFISARIDQQNGRYHFLVDSALRGVGRIVRYEGLLDVSH
jgi:hypothetical protein